jgi:hypothetical protein
MAMRPERLDVLTVIVTDLQTVTCTMSFLKVRAYPRNAVGGSHGESGAFAPNAGTLPTAGPDEIRPDAGFYRLEAGSTQAHPGPDIS